MKQIIGWWTLEWRCLLALVVSGVVLAVPGVSAAQSATADWEQTPLTVPVNRLFAPRSGALLAWTRDGLARSDDGGVQWTIMQLPPAGENSHQVVEVDPVDHTVLYADGLEGLYRVNGDGADWHVILPSTHPIQRLAVSPADHALLYVAMQDDADNEVLARSRDAGATWDTVDRWPGPTSPGAECRGIGILVAHPTDPARLFRSRSCELAQSYDQGASWTTALAGDQMAALGDMQELVGSGAGAPGRFYAIATLVTPTPARGVSLTTSALVRSDDDGASWQVVTSFVSDSSFRGLVADPTLPDRVYLGSGAPGSRFAAMSDDGGATWSQPWRSPVTAPSLVLGIDRRNLYAGGGKGVSRLPLEGAN